jgi:uncharacterized membrane protein
MTEDLRKSLLAEEYLAELGRAAAALPPNRREELLDDVRSHIAVARAEAKADDDAAIGAILGQLGDPEVIVAAALADLPDLPPMGAPPRAESWSMEIAAVVLLLVGGFLAGIGWVVGVVLLWSSRRWTIADKLLGTLLIPGGLVVPALVVGGALFASAQTCSNDSVVAGQQPVMQCTSSGGVTPAVGITVFVLLVAAPILTSVHLIRRARRKALAVTAAG